MKSEDASYVTPLVTPPVLSVISPVTDALRTNFVTRCSIIGFKPGRISRCSGSSAMAPRLLPQESAMAKFLTTSGITHQLEELIKGAEERVVLLSPYLQLHDRLRELLASRSRTDVKIQIVYGKKQLPLAEQRWLREVPRIKTKFRQNLHAKCYLTEKACIVTSMNLIEFSQQNNDEMGILILSDQDRDLYEEAASEVGLIVRGSRETNLDREDLVLTNAPVPARKRLREFEKLSTSKLARKLGIKTTALYQMLIGRGLVKKTGDNERLTPLGKQAGGQEVPSKNGSFVVWPPNLPI